VSEAPVDIGSDAANIDAVNFTEQGADVAAPGAGHTILYLLASGVARLRSSTTIYNLLVNVMTALGDTLYGGASGALTRLAGNTTTTKKFLTQTGDGGASAAPGWNTIATGDVPDLSATYLTPAAHDARDHTGVPGVGSGSGTGGHLHGLFRWASDGGTTVDLPDIAEYVDSLTDDGPEVDPATYSLSLDGSQLTLDSAPGAASVMVCRYVVAQI
jgi:hypothetical protein